MQFGATFRQLRELKGISLSSLASEEISKSQISRFELDENDISFQKLFYLLEQIKVTLPEFLVAANNHENSHFQLFLSHLSHSIDQMDTSSLQKLYEEELLHYEENRNDYHKLNSLMVLNAIYDFQPATPIKDSDCLFLSDYLFSVEEFGYYEFVLLANSYRILPSSLLYHYTDIVLESWGKQAYTLELQMLILQIGIHTLLIALDDHPEEAYHLLRDLNQLTQNSQFFYEQTLLLYLGGILKLSSSPQEAEQDILLALNILKLFKNSTYTRFYQHYVSYKQKDN